MSAGTAAAPRPLQAWFSDWLTATSDDLIYKKAASSQIMFVRDGLGRALADSYEQWQGALTVLSEHRSKSVRLPVYLITLPGLEMVIRDNFYNWKVSVRSDKPLDDLAGWGLFREDERHSACYCEGFPEEWVHGPYVKDRRRFTVEMRCREEVFTFCWLTRGRRTP